MLITELTLTFSDGESLSNEYVDCSGKDKAFAIFFEDGYGTTNCSFQVYTQDQQLSAPLFDADSSEVELTVDQTNGALIILNPAIFGGIAMFKVRRGNITTPFTTGDETATIKVFLREY